MTMYNYKLESEISSLRGEVVFIGAAIVGALLLNAYILIQIADDLHCLKEIEKENFKAKNSLEDEKETTITSEKVTEVPAATSEQKPVSEIKTEDEKQ